MDDYIKDISNSLDFNNNFHDINGLILNDYEISILDKYNIDYKKCSDLKWLIDCIEEVLNEESFDDLEEISISISERDYYENTHK